MGHRSQKSSAGLGWSLKEIKQVAPKDSMIPEVDFWPPHTCTNAKMQTHTESNPSPSSFSDFADCTHSLFHAGFPFPPLWCVITWPGFFCYMLSSAKEPSCLSIIQCQVTCSSNNTNGLTSVFQSFPWLEEKGNLGGVRQRLSGWPWGCKYRRPERELTQAVEVWWSGARTTF